MINGYPNALQFTRLSGAISSLKQDSEKARIELVTGRKADLQQALGNNLGEGMLIKKAIDDLDVYRLSGNRAQTRADVAQLGLTRINEAAVDQGVAIINAIGLNDDTSIRFASTQARNDLEAAFNVLNQRVEGRAIFAGDAVDTTPLADIEVLLADVGAIYAAAPDVATFETDLDFYLNDPTGGFATNVYLGGAGDAPRAEIADGELIDYSAKADEEAIKKLLGSLATVVVSADTARSEKRDDIIESAGNGLLESSVGINTIQARVGDGQNTIEGGLVSLDATEATLSESYNTLVEADPFETATRLQQLETQLQASFILSSRISQLSLANFI